MYPEGRQVRLGYSRPEMPTKEEEVTDHCYRAGGLARSLRQPFDPCAQVKADTGMTEDVFQHGHRADILTPMPALVYSQSSVKEHAV